MIINFCSLFAALSCCTLHFFEPHFRFRDIRALLQRSARSPVAIFGGHRLAFTGTLGGFYVGVFLPNKLFSVLTLGAWQLLGCAARREGCWLDSYLEVALVARDGGADSAAGAAGGRPDDEAPYGSYEPPALPHNARLEEEEACDGCDEDLEAGGATTGDIGGSETRSRSRCGSGSGSQSPGHSRSRTASSTGSSSSSSSSVSRRRSSSCSNLKKSLKKKSLSLQAKPDGEDSSNGDGEDEPIKEVLDPLVWHASLPTLSVGSFDARVSPALPPRQCESTPSTSTNTTTSSSGRRRLPMASPGAMYRAARTPSFERGSSASCFPGQQQKEEVVASRAIVFAASEVEYVVSGDSDASLSESPPVSPASSLTPTINAAVSLLAAAQRFILGPAVPSEMPLLPLARAVALSTETDEGALLPRRPVVVIARIDTSITPALPPRHETMSITHYGHLLNDEDDETSSEADDVYTGEEAMNFAESESSSESEEEDDLVLGCLTGEERRHSHSPRPPPLPPTHSPANLDAAVVARSFAASMVCEY